MKNKKKLIIGIGIIIILLLSVFIYVKINKKEMDDAKKFSKEYKTVSQDNVFKYKTAEEIIKILENGTGVVYLGFPQCPWCQAYVSMLNEAAKEVGITKIYYFNIKEDRDKKTKSYKRIVSLLGENLSYNDEGEKRVFVPDVTIVKNGTIIGHDNETSIASKEDGTPEEYWTAEKKNMLKMKLSNYMLQVVSNVCTDECNE